MIANANEAIETLRHGRTGEHLPTKIVARNTKLVYYTDELIGLQFHNTVIARFTPNGCIIDTRGDGREDGWFTVTTWERIDSFTQARTFTNRGLRFIDSGAGSGAMLYTHGTRVDAKGKVIDRPGLEPELDARICWCVERLPDKITRHCKKVVAAWADWDEPRDCCRDDDSPLHYLGHVERNEYVVPPVLDGLAQSIRSNDVWGDRLRDKLAKDFRDSLRRRLVPAAIGAIAPDFPYPQLERRRR